MLSRQSLEILVDLIEIKLSAIIVQDKDDLREVMKLRKCRRELLEAIKQCKSHLPTEEADEEELTSTEPKGFLQSAY